MSDDAVRRAFPAVDDIEDDHLRECVLRTWTQALAETGWDLDEIPWFPPVQDDLNLPDERLVPHVNDVVAGAVSLATTLRDRRDADVSMDVVRAGALVHDVSKVYEFDADGETPVHDLLGHPHYGVVPAANGGLPPEVLHVVLSHSRRTAVDPATLEAEIVRRVDQTAASAIRLQSLDDLRDA